MSDTPAVATLSQLAMDSVLPFDASSEAFEFVSEDLHLEETFVQSEGIRGTRSRYAHRVRSARKRVTGTIELNPSVTEIDRLLPRMLGGSTSLGVTDVAETLPTFLVMVDRISKVFTYDELRVGSWTLSGTSGQPLRLSLQLEGETESVGNSGTFPSLTIDTNNFFIMSDVTITLSSTSRKFASFTLSMDNHLDTERYHNSVSRTEIPSLDRTVMLELDAPYTTDNTDLYAQAVAGAAGSVVLADGTTTYTIAFGNVKIPSRSPNAAGRQEVRLPLRAQCFKTGSSSECKWTKT